MSTNNQKWRTLKTGDCVKVVGLPGEFSQDQYTLHDETRAVYLHLIESGQKLFISRIDDDGYPWTEFTIEGQNGTPEHHYLLLNHDGLELIPG